MTITEELYAVPENSPFRNLAVRAAMEINARWKHVWEIQRMARIWEREALAKTVIVYRDGGPSVSPEQWLK